MRRLAMLTLLAAAIYALSGCMVTDYPCITDSENPNYANCAGTECRGQNLEGIQGNPNRIGPGANEFEDDCPLHDTKGWAHIIESSLSATDLDNDGWTSEFIPFVSQDSAGNQMIVAMASVQNVPQADYVFHSDMYLQGGQQDIDPYAYAIYTNSTYTVSRLPGAVRPGDTGDITGSCVQDPEFDEHAYDYQFGTTCTIADADLSMLQAYFTRIGEAGRREGNGPYGLSFEDRLELLRNATPTDKGLEFTFDKNLTLVSVEQGPHKKTLDLSIFHGRSFTIDPDREGIVGNLLLKQWKITAEEFMFVADQLRDIQPHQRADLTIKHGDIDFSMPFAFSRTWDPALTAQGLAGSRTGQTATGGRRGK